MDLEVGGVTKGGAPRLAPLPLAVVNGLSSTELASVTTERGFQASELFALVPDGA